MMKKLVQVPVLMAAGLLMGAPGFAQVGVKEAKDVKEAVQTAAYDITDKHSVVIDFAKDSSQLSASEAAELRTTLAAFKDDAKVKEIVIASYSDLPYPSGKESDKPAKSRELAEARGKAIEKVIEQAGGKNVKIYNMAKKANWFEKTFVTSDAQIKNEAAESAGNTSADDAFYQALGRRLTAVGGPGKAVVVMRGEFLLSH